MTHFAALLSIGCYLFAALVFMLQLWKPSRTGRLRRCAYFVSALALSFHTVVIALVLRDLRFFALDNGADYFLWVSWLLALVFVVFRRWFDYPMLGAFIASSVILFMGSSSYLLHQKSTSVIESAGSSNGAQSFVISLLHGVPALISVVSLVLALAVSLAFLIVERRLKSRRSLDLEGRGMNLQVLDRLNNQLVRIGFVAISLVIVSGGLWAVVERKSVFTTDSSVISGLIVWLLLALILFARSILRWSPRRISRLTVVVAASFILSVFAVLALAGRTTHVAIFY